MRALNSDPEALQRLIARAIRAGGVALRVSVSPARAAGRQAPRSRFIPAIVEPPNTNDIGHLRELGGANAASPVPLVFTFTGDSDVQENDRVEYEGDIYVLLNALPHLVSGINIGVRCVGVRRVARKPGESE